MANGWTPAPERILVNEQTIIPRFKADRLAFLQRLQEQAREEGFAAGVEMLKKKQLLNPDITRQDALKAVTAYMSAAGQTIQAFAEAMKSERNQL